MSDVHTVHAIQHPVKDIVIPLVVVIGLIGNAVIVGVGWGKITTQVAITESRQREHESKSEERNAAQDRAIQELRDRTHDLTRDMRESERRFLLLDDYTRGRIDTMRYKSPPPARW